jgi:transcriptional regulator with XRE-family HTH domain
MKKSNGFNHWKKYHSSLKIENSKKFKALIEKKLGISQSTFYRKLKNPQRYLSIAEKYAIAAVYGLDEGYLFPELDEDIG